MYLAAYCFAAVMVLAVPLGLKSIWRARRILVFIYFVILLASTAWVVYEAIDMRKLLLAVASSAALYQFFNIYRALKSSLNSEHLRQITFRSALRLFILSAILLAVALLVNRFDPSFNQSLSIAIISYLLGLILLASVWSNLAYVPEKIGETLPVESGRLPTLSVAIPARNETESLYYCLKSLLGSNYPKLEILVLDDNSSDKRTPEIIRSFAHDGVIFIAGKPYGETWLAKNRAYQQLLEAANGEYILFCGADTRFSKDALHQLVGYQTKSNHLMLSVMPFNTLPNQLKDRFLQPLRYVWEVGLPRRSLKRPAVLSTCWLIKRDFVSKLGGFKGVSRRVSPESYFAKKAFALKSYSFFQYQGLVSQKDTSSELETLIRLRYPQLRRQTESVFLASLIEITTILGPILILILAIINHHYLVFLFAALTYLFYSTAFYMLAKLCYHSKSLWSFLLWPYYVALDLIIMNLSMWRYELGVVLWKGRSIAPSVMGVELKS